MLSVVRLGVVRLSVMAPTKRPTIIFWSSDCLYFPNEKKCGKKYHFNAFSLTLLSFVFKQYFPYSFLVVTFHNAVKMCTERMMCASKN